MTEPAWKSYVRAGVFLIPAFVAWLFAEVFLLPALRSDWQFAGMTGGKLQWLLNGSSAFILYGRFILLFVTLVFYGLETWSKSWPQYRRISLATVVFLINTAVFVDLLWALIAFTMVCRHLLHDY